MNVRRPAAFEPPADDVPTHGFGALPAQAARTVETLEAWAFDPGTAHRSPLTAHRSPLTAHRSPLTAHRSPLTAHRSPLTAHRSPLTAHRSPLTAHRIGEQAPAAFATVPPTPGNRRRLSSSDSDLPKLTTHPRSRTFVRTRRESARPPFVDRKASRAAEGAHPQTLRQKDRPRRRIRLTTCVGRRFSHSGERQ
ncbi:aminomethyltransferase domain protein [Burkholderia mallei]|nr:aminomethyltransferase domain protein [Burkholderia mallei]